MGGLSALASMALTGITDTYYRMVLYTRPIAYWPLWETGGTSARCLVNPAQNGTYTGVTTGQRVTDANGVSFICPFFDGTNDFVHVNSAALQSAFNGATGSLMTWVRVFNVGVWTDGTERRFSNFVVDGNNFAMLRRSSVNQRFDWYYRAGGTQALRGKTSYTNINWFHLVLTWNATQSRFYLNGVEDLPAIANGVWAGVPTVNVIGAANTTPTNPHHGWLAHVALWDRVLSQAEITNLAAGPT